MLTPSFLLLHIQVFALCLLLVLHSALWRKLRLFHIRLKILLFFCLPPVVPNSLQDYSLLGSSVHGISYARILEWDAISSSRGSSSPGIKPMSLCLLHWQADSLLLSHLLFLDLSLPAKFLQIFPPLK